MLKIDLLWKASNSSEGSSSNACLKVFIDMEKGCLYAELVAQINVIL